MHRKFRTCAVMAQKYQRFPRLLRILHACRGGRSGPAILVHTTIAPGQNDAPCAARVRRPAHSSWPPATRVALAPRLHRLQGFHRPAHLLLLRRREHSGVAEGQEQHVARNAQAFIEDLGRGESKASRVRRSFSHRCAPLCVYGCAVRTGLRALATRSRYAAHHVHRRLPADGCSTKSGKGHPPM